MNSNQRKDKEQDSKKSNISAVDTTLKSTLAFKAAEGYKYALKISNKNTTAVNVLKKLDPSATAATAKDWMLRFDNAHAKTPYPHLNIRHRHTGINDPHLKLPPGALTAVQGFAYIAKLLNWVSYLTFAMDVTELGQAAYKDHQNGTLNNTAKCAALKTGQYVGGFVASTSGGLIGGFLMPGIGPLIGALSPSWIGVKYGGDLMLKYVLKKLKDGDHLEKETDTNHVNSEEEDELDQKEDKLSQTFIIDRKMLLSKL